MPSLTKTLHYIASALVTSISVAVLGFAMSTWWAKSTMECARAGSEIFNGTAEVTLGLFDGILTRSFCPSFGNTDVFQVIPLLTKTTTTSLVLHVLVVCLLALCLLCSAGSILISLYNSVSNPYETYMGPVGVYVCSSISACLSVVVLIIFVLNVAVTSMSEELVDAVGESISVDLKNKSAQMGVGFFLVLPYAVFSVVAISLIFFYDHAAYTHRREQERPTEDAPKEIMMY